MYCKTILFFVFALSFSILPPYPSYASDPVSEQYIIGFNDASLKVLIKEEKASLTESLRPLLKSRRASQKASGTLGRLKRKLIGAINKGSQRHLPLIDAKFVSVRPGDVQNQLNLQYAKDIGLIKYAEPNIEITAYISPNDPQFKNLWGLNNTGKDFLSVEDIDINAPQAWDISTGNSSVAVAILDTGFDPSINDLTANVWKNKGEIAGNGTDDDNNGYIDDFNGCDLISYSASSTRNCGKKPFRNNSHGTHVAGTIGASPNNSLGISGIIWKTQLVSLAFLDENGSGSLLDMIEGLTYAVEMKRLHDRTNGRSGVNIRVINASFGHNDGFLQAEYDAIKALASNNILLVAAAGNGGSDGVADNNDTSPSYPASYDLDNIVSVAAIGKSGKLTYFSNYGVKSVDVAAPGEGILSTVFGGQYQSLSGTSMAAPHVSGIAGLIIGHRPDLAPWVVKEIIIASAKDASVNSALKNLAGKISSAGLVDAKAALELAESDIQSPLILKNPQDQTAVKGGDVTLSISAMGTAPLKYQWQKGGSPISGATFSSLTLKNIKASDAGQYRCTVSNSLGKDVSKAATLSVNNSINGDVNSDSLVNLSDLVTVLTDIGKRGRNLASDLNKDGAVDFKDVSLMLRYLRSNQ